MNRRIYMTGGLVCVAVVAVWATISQHQTLDGLRAERRALVNHLSGGGSDPSDAAIHDPSSQEAAVPPELLQLRSEVTRLAARKQQLAFAQIQNKQLRQALAGKSASTNTGALPPGFVRKTQAKFAGFNAPQDTLQSFMWALQNRDSNNLLQALAPASVQELQTQFQRSSKASEKFFEEMQAFIGFRILEQRQALDGTMQLKVEVVPGLPPGDIRFHLINGQWLMDLPR